MLEATRPGTGCTDLEAEWVIWMQISKGLLPNTIRLYTKVIQEAQRAIPDLPHASTEELERWVQTRGGKASTTSNRISALTSYYRFLVKTKRRPDNPAAEMDRPKRRKGVPKPVRDLEGALEILDRYDAKVEGRRVGETRDMATFIAETGLRISEACAIELKGPCPDQMTIIGKGHKERFVLFTPAARDAIDRLGGRLGIGSRAIQRRFERAEFHPHQLRHWRATSLVKKGTEIGTISKIMGHSSPAITMVYAEYDTQTMRNALEA